MWGHLEPSALYKRSIIVLSEEPLALTPNNHIRILLLGLFINIEVILRSDEEVLGDIACFLDELAEEEIEHGEIFL